MKTISHRKFTVLCIIACSLLIPAVLAQNPDPLVYTVGKTFQTNGGTGHHNYLLWQPGNAQTTFGKRFGIYSKNGDSVSASPYTLQGIQSLQVSPSAIQALLKLGEKFDANGASLLERIVALNAEANATPLPEDFVPPTTITLEIAQKLAQITTVALEDAEVLQSLVSLGRVHPGVQMSLGLGFAIETTPASITTYEVREIDPGGNDVRVIGRVTLDAANPQGLVAPGRPIQIFHPNDPSYQTNASPKDHLTVLTRWSTPAALRALLPHAYGYNIYRIPSTIIDTALLDPAELEEVVDLVNLGGVRVNSLPAITSLLLTDAEATDPSFEAGIFFHGDDKSPPADPFTDGDTFYYYISARDIAGHAGPLSKPTLITVCDRLPPSTPAIISVDNVFDLGTSDPGNDTGTQHLRINIRQVPENPAENSASSYRVYRWHSANDWQRHGGDPELNFIGEVAHVPGKAVVWLDDDDDSDLDTDGPGGTGPDGLGGVDTGAPVVTNEADLEMGQTFWYTVRAVDNTACAPKNFSGHCGAVFGVPRDRVGPEQPKGSLITCFCIPKIQLTTDGTPASRPLYGVDDTFPGFVVRVSRTDPKDRFVIRKVTGFDVEFGAEKASDGSFDVRFSRTYVYRGLEQFGDTLVPLEAFEGSLLRVRSRLGDGSVSDWLPLTRQTDATNEGEIIRYEFLASARICCPTIIPSRSLRQKDGSIDPRILGLLPSDNPNAPDCPPWIEVDPGITPPSHTPIGPNGSITGVCGNVYLSGDIREVRIYRRVGRTGDLQLIARQSGQSALQDFTWKESAPTLVNGVECCYYAQSFDQHGNASPLTRIGCVTVVNEDLGIPILMDPVDLDPTGSFPVVGLSWFCDPVGIDRFELWVAADGDVDPGIQSEGQLSTEIESDINQVLTDEDGNELSFSVFRTNSLTSGFGNGGEFSLNLTVPAGRKLHYAIRPIGPQVRDTVTSQFEFSRGSFSNIVSGTWIAPAEGPQDIIPWPARPLPGIADLGIKVDDYIPGEGPFFAYPIPSAEMNAQGASAAIFCGTFPSVSNSDLPSVGNFPGDRDPAEWLFNYRKQPTSNPGSNDFESILPLVVYRYQIPGKTPGAPYPNAKPNLIQVTPLLDRISFRKLSIKVGPNFTLDYDYFRVRDPFFIFQNNEQTFPSVLPVPLSGTFSRDVSTFITGAPLPPIGGGPPYLAPLPSDVPAQSQRQNGTIWIKDAIPAARGASYQYMLVTFTARGEIARVIPTNTITHSP